MALTDSAGLSNDLYLVEESPSFFAEKVYEGIWRDRIRQLYGAEPEIQYYEPLLIVDNKTGEIIIP